MPDSEQHPTVLLRHELPDGTHHFDWLIARDAEGALVTFRLDRDVSLDRGAFAGERLADHRRVYLEYEGEVSGGRGAVRRVARGRCAGLTETDEAVEVWVDLGVRRGRLRGIRQGNGRFLFGPA